MPYKEKHLHHSKTIFYNFLSKGQEENYRLSNADEPATKEIIKTKELEPTWNIYWENSSNCCSTKILLKIKNVKSIYVFINITALYVLFQYTFHYTMHFWSMSYEV